MLLKPASSLASWSRLAVAAVLLAIAFPAQPQSGKPQKANMPRAERHELKHEIDKLEEDWRTAVLHRDTAAMASLLSEDYVGITAVGTLQSKEEEIADLRSGAVRFTQLDLSDRKVRFYGKTALVTSKAEVSGTTGDGDISGSYRYTRVYARDGKGGWKVVSFEASRIRN